MNITTLVERHRELDVKITREENRPMPDRMKLKEMKSKKLWLKDRITNS